MNVVENKRKNKKEERDPGVVFLTKVLIIFSLFTAFVMIAGYFLAKSGL